MDARGELTPRPRAAGPNLESGRKLSRRRHSWMAHAILASALVFTAGCDRSPAQHLELAGTTWTVATVGGQALPKDLGAGMALDQPRLGWVTVETGCRRLEVPFAYDTDGDALSFDLSAIDAGGCTGEAKEVDEAIIENLRTAMSWRLIGDASIEIVGANRMAMTRAGADPAPSSIGSNWRSRG
jgi:hypothetical protein